MSCQLAGLARTGVPAETLLILAIGLILAGCALLAVARHDRPGWGRRSILVAAVLGVCAVAQLSGAAAGQAAAPGNCTSSGGDAGQNEVPPPIAVKACGVDGLPIELAATTAAAEVGSPISFTATVTSTDEQAEAGAVTLLDAGVSIGSRSDAGTTTTFTTSALPVGIHRITATFSPAAGGCGPLSSEPIMVLVTGVTSPSGGTGGADIQTITASIPAGFLVITTPYTAAHPLAFGDLRLDPSASAFVGSCRFGDGTINGSIHVTDTRSGNSDWAAWVQSGALTDGVGGLISGDNLGLVELSAIEVPGNALTVNSVQLIDQPGPLRPVGGSTSVGLSQGPRLFARSVRGGNGTIGIDGTLTLLAPTATPAGSYTGTLTFTIG
jgi:hypothetical protein